MVAPTMGFRGLVPMDGLRTNRRGGFLTLPQRIDNKPAGWFRRTKPSPGGSQGALRAQPFGKGAFGASRAPPPT